jgi:glucose/arabinose dehydrogenase
MLLTAAAFAAPLAGTGAAHSPVTSRGRPAQLVAGYVGTPTAFAFSPNHVFMSDGTLHPLGIGGVYLLEHGTARRLADSPPFSNGLAWRNGALFISTANQLLAWRGWTGQKFTRSHVIYTAQPGFSGFTGLAFGPSGRLYVGVGQAPTSDHAPASAADRYDILSMTARGTQVRIVARGIRDPWQLVFRAGSVSPFATDPGQLAGAQPAPDLLLRVRQGQNYGFPTCNWTQTSLCRGFARPVRRFAAHSDPLGLAIVGQRLYISEFGVRTPAQVISIPLSLAHQGQVALSGFPSRRHIVGLGAHDGWVYVGETAAGRRRFGSVWRFRP